MSSLMMPRAGAGAGAVTVEGLTPGVLLAGHTVTVKRGDKTVQAVTGNVLPEFVFKSSGNQETSRSYTFSKDYAFVVIVGFYTDTGVTGFTVNTGGELMSTDAVGTNGQYVPKGESKVYANIKSGDTVRMNATGPSAWGARLLIYGFGQVTENG